MLGHARPTPPDLHALHRRPTTGVSLGRAATVTAALIAGLWVQEGADQLVFQGQLDQFGIEPRAPGTFWHVLTAPFLHAGFGHLIANTVPLAVLTFMSALRGVARFLAALLLIVLIGGGLVWLLGRGGSVHLGASELVFGLLAYLLGVGWWERTRWRSAWRSRRSCCTAASCGRAPGEPGRVVGGAPVRLRGRPDRGGDPAPEASPTGLPR